MPLISVSGAQGLGKTTFIKDFIAAFPMYKTPEISYRDIVKERGFSINKETTQEAQKAILEHIVETIYSKPRDEFWIFDRAPIDNIVYSIWAFDKGVGDIDHNFVADCINISRKATQKLDLMFIIPITEYNIKMIDDDLRDTDLEYQKEINELFLGLQRKRMAQNDDTFFVKDDSPPFIEIFGDRAERVEMARLYIQEDGNFYGEEDSLLLDANGDYITADDEIDTGERDQLRKQLGIDNNSY